MTKERAEEECTTMGEAYTEGYQQGRADAFQEIAYSDSVIKEPFETLAYEKGKADERAKTIEELRSFIDKHYAWYGH